MDNSSPSAKTLARGSASAYRRKKLLKFADLIDENQEELALLEVPDMGKPIQDSVTPDIPNLANSTRWSLEAIDKFDNWMRIAQEEIFGPVISTIMFKDMDDVNRTANDTTYDLVASIFTASLSTADTSARALRCGAVLVNCFDPADVTVPHGGYKGSGNGHDRSFYSPEEYAELKTIWIQLD